MRCLLLEPRQLDAALLTEEQEEAVEVMKQRIDKLGANVGLEFSFSLSLSLSL